VARTKGSVGSDTEKAIRATAIRLMVSHGYEAMTLRQLAEAVGIQAGSVYRYYGAKDRLLAEIMIDHMEAVLAALLARLDGMTDPYARLEAFVDFHIRYHIEKQDEVFLAYMELRSLDVGPRDKVIALRASYERVLIDILKDGMADGVFAQRDASVSAYALIAMLTGVCQWYSPGGRLTPDAIVDIHRDLVMRGVAGDQPPSQPSMTPDRPTTGDNSRH
jgi:AcrR family transcriptional regulator